LRVNGKVNTEERSRGIYTLPVYRAKLKVAGEFSNQALLDTARGSKVNIDWQRPYLAVAISDIRGVTTQPQLHWAGRDYEFGSGSGLAELGGMHVRVGALDVDKAAQYRFDFEVDLHGMEQLDFSPVGKNTEVNLSSDWPHPSFTGRYLPTQRTITDNAFDARWQVSSFSSDMVQTMDALSRGQVGDFTANTFGVSLVNAVDVYQQTERSAKYGVLFVSLTFVVFFLFEVMKGLRLHPMQYLLVGLALTVFFLLLISLAEHIPFAAAYAIAAAASVGVIGVYISEVLQSRPRAAAFSAMLALLYAMLFAILRSEDNALLMGSLLLFGMLTLVMVVTRKLDWYSVAEQMTRQAVLLDEEDRAGTRQ
jgi:inner membrane protein